MKILCIRPVARNGDDRRFRDLADFDVLVNEGLRLLGLRLVEAPNGRRLVYSPAKHGRAFATFGPEFAREISATATAALNGGHEANAQRPAV
jgi:hypothetical protein